MLLKTSGARDADITVGHGEFARRGKGWGEKGCTRTSCLAREVFRAGACCSLRSHIYDVGVHGTGRVGAGEGQTALALLVVHGGVTMHYINH